MRVIAAPQPAIHIVPPPPSPPSHPPGAFWKHPIATVLGGSLAAGGPAADIKRGADVLVATIAILLAAPLILGVALVLIAVERQFPFFRDTRVGLEGAEFRCWKFQTMRGDWTVLARYLERNPDEARRYAEQRKLRADPRVTRIGRYLRVTSVDELPQLLNVLRGEMSLIGPRPLSIHEFEQRGWRRWQVVSIRPGISGLWQVSGRGTTSLRERAAMDAFYVRHGSLAMDLRIAWKTPLQVFRRVGAW